MRNKTSLISLLLLLLFAGSGVAQCVQGDCTNGYGLYRTGQTYQLSNWKNGKAEGEGMQVVFYTPSTITSAYKNTEGEFLMLTAFEQPTIDAVLKLLPQIVIKGVFTGGELNGPGTLYATDIKKLPEFNWLLQFTERWIGGSWSWRQMRYDGQFVKTQPSGQGTMKLTMPNAVISCTGQQLNYLDNPDVIIEVEGGYFPKKGLFRGSFKNGVAHGFAVTNVKGNSLLPGGELRRQAWVYGWPELLGEAGMYPKDEGGTTSLKLANGTSYTGPLDDKQRPLGFGKQVKTAADGKDEWVYTGYFFEGLKSGIGLMEHMSLHNKTFAGYFSRDTFSTGTAFSFGNNYFFRTNAPRYNLSTALALDCEARMSQWASRKDYGSATKEIESYSGHIGKNGLYDGYGTLYKDATARSGNWRGSTLVTQLWGSIDYYSLNDNCVVVIDGMAAPVKKDFLTGRWKTSDGKLLPVGGTLQLSRYTINNFAGSCNTCNGSGTQSIANRVEASSTTYSSSYSTTEGGGPYMDSYWKKTSTLSFTSYRPAYTQYTYKTCSVCNGGGKLTSSIPLKE